MSLIRSPQIPYTFEFKLDSCRLNYEKTDTQVKVSGYQGVINSYSSVRGNSFLSYYSSNVKNQYSVSSTTYNSQQKGSEIEIDISKKISLIVDSNDKIIEVLENNFFQEPYYGVLIKFYE